MTKPPQHLEAPKRACVGLVSTEDEELEAFSPVVVEEVLHEEKTEYQTLMIFRSKSYGTPGRIIQ